MSIRSKLLLLSFLFLINFMGALDAQGYLHADNKKIVDSKGNEVILKGLNFGNFMIMEGYMMNTSDVAGTQHEIKSRLKALIGETNTNTFYNAWLDNHVTKADIDSVKKWGMNSVRVPIHYEYFKTTTDKGFKVLDSIVKWCRVDSIYAIIDLHAAPGGQGKNASISDYDSSRPSLWESQANKDLTVWLWKEIARRYSTEPFVGGYDLINETNWTMTNNADLRSLYGVITDSIRKYDQNHILFIEGNDFANNFTGLTPAWDHNMVYSFHKYWSNNGQSNIQFALTLRDAQNCPIWCGETGENSNHHFTKEMELFSQFSIGSAWWPMKKFESINSFVKANWPANYSKILNYFSNPANAPDPNEAFTILMQMAENLNIKNCKVNKDMLYAIMQQPGTTKTKPYDVNNIPGNIPATHYDMGVQGTAYSDKIYQTTTSGSASTNWNTGWAYRNDGVDIQACTDSYSNGYNVGWIENGEWMRYTVNVNTTGVYDVVFRVSSSGGGGYFHLENSKGEDITGTVVVPATGSWTSWASDTVKNVVLTKGTDTLKLYIDKSGFNVNTMIWSQPKNILVIPVRLMSAITTTDGSKIILTFNKELKQGINVSASDFSISGGTGLSVSTATQGAAGSKTIELTLSGEMLFDNVLTLSYNGSTIFDTDNTRLDKINGVPVINRMPTRYYIPGKVEAENYSVNAGFTSETNSDADAGKDMGYTDSGDYLEYLVYVNQPGVYSVDYRVAVNASAGASGKISLLDNGTEQVLNTSSFPNTSGWQNWSTVTSTGINLTKGPHTLRFTANTPGFNINYLNFNYLSTGLHTSTNSDEQVCVFPNPSSGLIYILCRDLKPDAVVEVYNIHGQKVLNKIPEITGGSTREFDLGKLPKGVYFLKVSSGFHFISKKIVID